MIEEIEIQWKELINRLNKSFDADLDIQAVIFLIGLQELGQGYRKYKKEEKLDIMHVAVCTLLEPYGYYDFEGKDAQGWPHWKVTEKLPNLKPGQQLVLMKEAILGFFEKQEIQGLPDAI